MTFDGTCDLRTWGGSSEHPRKLRRGPLLYELELPACCLLLLLPRCCARRVPSWVRQAAADRAPMERAHKPGTQLSVIDHSSANHTVFSGSASVFETTSTGISCTAGSLCSADSMRSFRVGRYPLSVLVWQVRITLVPLAVAVGKEEGVGGEGGRWRLEAIVNAEV
jgi:hypothetical protein